MFQVVAYKCSKCNGGIKPGKEKTLQLVNRDKRVFLGNALVPTIENEYTLCPKCFREFTESMKFKGGGVLGDNEDE